MSDFFDMVKWQGFWVLNIALDLHAYAYLNMLEHEWMVTYLPELHDGVCQSLGTTTSLGWKTETFKNKIKSFINSLNVHIS